MFNISKSQKKQQQNNIVVKYLSPVSTFPEFLGDAFLEPSVLFTASFSCFLVTVGLVGVASLLLLLIGDLGDWAETCSITSPTVNRCGVVRILLWGEAASPLTASDPVVSLERAWMDCFHFGVLLLISVAPEETSVSTFLGVYPSSEDMAGVLPFFTAEAGFGV